jgi:hypothetical protein
VLLSVQPRRGLRKRGRLKMKAEIKPLDKGFALMLGDHELGVSKTDFDARFHMHAINNAIKFAQIETSRQILSSMQDRLNELEIEVNNFEIDNFEIKEIK